MRTLQSVALMSILALGSGVTARAQSCPHQGLASFGPISEATFGYPAYYVDQNGLGLGLCLDPADRLCGLPPLPHPSEPLDIATGNFFAEHLYTFVTADVTMPGGGKGLLVFAITGTFGAAAVIPGDQAVFSRVRFRIDTPAAGTYTITHPFGVHTLTAGAAGRRSINFTDDCLLSVPPTCGPAGLNAFTTPLAPFSWISTWLQWDTTPPAPPAGFIGDPAILHPIAGSPCGTNFFRVEGPGLPAGGVQTNLWSVLGKKASVCGNGMVEPGEQCDDGNTVAGDCCDPTCQLEPAGAPCTGTNPCFAETTCDGAGVCGGGTPTMATCNDGNACTTADTCAGGVCVGGPGLNCNDANVCTDDACNPAFGCVNTANTASCTDGNACTTTDSCAGGTCVGGPPPNCNDANVCTDDSCDPATGCVHTPNTAPCDDANACTTADTCAGGVCVGGPPPFCPTNAPLAAVTADAYVQSDLPDTNFGTSSLLAVDNGVAAAPGTTGVQRTFLRVSVGGVGPRRVSSAHLQLQVANVTNAQSVTGGVLHAITGCSWDERTVTWSTQPAIDGPVLAVLGAVAQGQTVDFDVTPAISGDGVYCFALDTISTDSALYSSREATVGTPQVAVTAVCPCGPAPTTTTTSTTTTTEPPPTTTTTVSETSTTTTTLASPAPVATVLADTFVQDDRPTTNFGTNQLLCVDAGFPKKKKGGVQRTFIRVGMSGVGTRRVTSVRLQLQVARVRNARSALGARLHVVRDCTWNEGTITWKTQPAIDRPVLAKLGMVVPGQTVEFDVTPAIHGDGVYCFAIDTPSTDGTDYSSRESAGGRPQVSVQLAP